MLSARKKLLDEAIPMAITKLQDFVSQPLSGVGGTGGDQGRYGAVCVVDTGLELKAQQHPCHAYMRNYNNALVVLNQYSHRLGKINKGSDKAFFDWITSDRGPWREFPNRLETELPSDYKKDKADWIFKNGWVWTNLDVSANLQHSFLTAARMPAEWPESINRWYRLVEEGCREDMAFLFLTLFMPHNKKKGYNYINRSNKYDWPVDICTAGETYVKNFCSGKVTNLIQMYSKNPQYRPVNTIFGKTDKGNSNKEAYPNILFNMYGGKIGLSEKECAELYEKNNGSSLTKFVFSNNWTVSDKDLVKIIQLETERLL